MKRRVITILIIALVLTQFAGACEGEDWSIKTDAEDTLLGGTCEDGYHETYTENPDDGMATYCKKNE